MQDDRHVFQKQINIATVHVRLFLMPSITKDCYDRLKASECKGRWRIVLLEGSDSGTMRWALVRWSENFSAGQSMRHSSRGSCWIFLCRQVMVQAGSLGWPMVLKFANRSKSHRAPYHQCTKFVLFAWLSSHSDLVSTTSHVDGFAPPNLNCSRLVRDCTCKTVLRAIIIFQRWRNWQHPRLVSAWSDHASSGWRNTYLRPKQPLGPKENGWLACLMSLLNGSSHREGINS